MNAIVPRVEDCVEVLVKAFPVEDIWLLERNAANACELDAEHNLIVVVPESEAAHKVEAEMQKLLAQEFAGSGIEAFVFPLSAIDRIPRPLMVKMALTSGERIYCG